MKFVVTIVVFLSTVLLGNRSIAETNPKPLEQREVEAVLNRDLTKHYARFQQLRSGPEETYAAHFYRRFHMQYKVGIYVLGIGAPVAAGASALGFWALWRHELHKTCDDEGNCSVSWGAALGKAFGLAAIGAIGGIITGALLIAGVVLIVMNHHKVKGLEEIMSRKSSQKKELTLTPTAIGFSF
jgi:hypothetical protein